MSLSVSRDILTWPKKNNFHLVTKWTVKRREIFLVKYISWRPWFDYGKMKWFEIIDRNYKEVGTPLTDWCPHTSLSNVWPPFGQPRILEPIVWIMFKKYFPHFSSMSIIRVRQSVNKNVIVVWKYMCKAIQLSSHMCIIFADFFHIMSNFQEVSWFLLFYASSISC